ncbi:MAG: Asp-tRNA(Asn)/Glu-tRNA(Gln) amidotransferase subunit GatC [Planctomycetes bacterium]|nr:Asp-tRNA(Asn)/Glu-tRNA(Gln) amidotransferase subunit GatC [Planctomycetota bacterium]
MDEATVRHVAHLARLELSDEEIAKFTGDLTAITDYVAQLAKVSVEGVEGTVHPVADRNLWREDRVIPSFKREDATGNAPDSEQNFFKVPPAIE